MKYMCVTLFVVAILVIIVLVAGKAINNKEGSFCLDYMTDRISNTGSSKTVLLIHGYPEPIYEDSPLYKFFADRGYNIVAPYLFTPEFVLTKQGTKKYIESRLAGRTPELIVGLSMGGLIAPQIAADFPESKLVLIATGPYIKTGVQALNTTVRDGNSNFLQLVFKTGRLIPTWLYSIIYKVFNHPKVASNERKLLEKHIRENWSCVTNVPIQEDVEIVNFLASTDNTELLKTLKNMTLIFAGDGDIMMPTELSTELNKLIKDSKLVISKNRLHYSVFNKENYQDLEDFLKD